jgi:hypothetical protein
MIQWSTAKAVVLGIAVLILAQILYLGVLLKVEHHELLRALLLFFPGIAAFSTAYLAPDRKMLAGGSMALWGAVISVLSATAYEQLGFPVDRLGGVLATFTIVLAYYAALSFVGSIAGHILSRNKAPKSDTSRSKGNG